MSDLDQSEQLWYSSAVEVAGCSGLSELLEPVAQWICKGLGKNRKEDQQNLRSRLLALNSGGWPDSEKPKDRCVLWELNRDDGGPTKWEAYYGHPYKKGPWAWRNDFNIEKLPDERWRVHLAIYLRDGRKSGTSVERPTRPLRPYVLEALGLTSEPLNGRAWRLFSGTILMDGKAKKLSSLGANELRDQLLSTLRKHAVMVLGHRFATYRWPNDRLRKRWRPDALAARYRGGALIVRCETTEDADQLSRVDIKPPDSHELIVFSPQLDPIVSGSLEATKRLRAREIRYASEQCADELDNAVWCPSVSSLSKISQVAATSPASDARRKTNQLNLVAAEANQQALVELLCRHGLTKHPSTSADVVLWMKELFKDSLLFAPKVLKERTPVKADILWRVLWVMGNELCCWLREKRPRTEVEERYYKMARAELTMGESGKTMNDPSCKRSRRCTIRLPNGEALTVYIWAHVHLSKGQRLYFAYDRDRSDQIIIGHIGEHLRISSGTG